VAEAGEAEIDAAVQAAALLDSKEWRELPARRRGQLLYRIAELLEQRAPEIAEIETKNNASRCSSRRSTSRWPSRRSATSRLGRQLTATRSRERQLLHYTLREPVGLVGAIVRGTSVEPRLVEGGARARAGARWS